MVTRWVVVVTCLAACSEAGSAPADAAHADAPSVDAQIDASDLDASTSYPLGLNDVSMLFRLPRDPLRESVVGRLSGIQGTTGDLVPREIFDRLVTMPGESTWDFADYHIVAARFDLCDRETTGPCPTNADGQLRLVFQPAAGAPPSGDPSVFSAALHAFFDVPRAELPGVIADLRAIAELHGMQTAAPLGVYNLDPSIEPTAHGAAVRILIGRLAVPAQLSRVTFSTVDARDGSRRFTVFRGVERSGTSFPRLEIPTTQAFQQTLADGPAALGLTSTPVSDTPGGFALALDRNAFDAAPMTDQLRALTAIVTTENPTMHTFKTLSCVGCHTPIDLVRHRASSIGIEPMTIPGRFTSADHDLSVDLGNNALDWFELRAFAWTGTWPRIRPRVANESAVVLDEIEERFP